jgi:phosphoglycerate dehydrogenase-like enzyme
MVKTKVAFLSPYRDRAEFIIGLAPSDLEVTLVDSALPEEEKAAMCREAEAIITLPANVSVDLLRRCPRVKLIQTLSAGYELLDLGAIGEMGIPVANNGGANAVAVAEQTIALMIGICKRVMLQWHTASKDRRWRGNLSGMDMVEVTGKTVGIVGLGRIGKQVAKRLKGFDTSTIYYDIVEMPPEVQRELNAHPVAFDELLRQSDIVTLHVPLTRRTRGMIGDRELEMMKPTAFLISDCRGPVVDERALYQALKNGRIAGAGLDVLEQEPTPADNPLFELDNVVITPHMAGFSYETNLRAADFAYSNIRRVLSGQPPESLVTPED